MEESGNLGDPGSWTILQIADNSVEYQIQYAENHAKEQTNVVTSEIKGYYSHNKSASLQCSAWEGPVPIIWDCITLLNELN